MNPQQITLEEYKYKSEVLSEIEPLQKCCNATMSIVHVEPLEGRNILEIERSCIIECPSCGKRYKSKWD